MRNLQTSIRSLRSKIYLFGSRDGSGKIATFPQKAWCFAEKCVLLQKHSNKNKTDVKAKYTQSQFLA